MSLEDILYEKYRRYSDTYIESYCSVVMIVSPYYLPT